VHTKQTPSAIPLEPHTTAKMNINKRLDRVKQWAGEKMGADVKTNMSDQFKALELEMALRQDGMTSTAAQ
jgi:hypothetical protein